MGRSTLSISLLALVTCIGLTCCALSARASECKDLASGLERTKINIVSVEFRPESVLPDHLRSQVSEALLGSKLTKSPEQSDDEWLGELVEVTARDVLSNQGYFQTRIDIVPYLEKAGPCAQFYAASVSIQSGPQYRLRKLGFIAKVFSEAQLKDQMQVAPGDIFDVSKIRAGLEAVRRMHCRQGYIDSTFEPIMDLDESHGLIDLTIKAQEETQYRVNSVQILFAKRNVETFLRSQINVQKGDIFDYPSLLEVLTKNRTLLPPDISIEELISVKRDTRDGTVDIVIDYLQ
jgi:outer membrane protein assembly factor BamA